MYFEVLTSFYAVYYCWNRFMCSEIMTYVKCYVVNFDINHGFTYGYVILAFIIHFTNNSNKSNLFSIMFVLIHFASKWIKHVQISVILFILNVKIIFYLKSEFWILFKLIYKGNPSTNLFCFCPITELNVKGNKRSGVQITVFNRIPICSVLV